VSEAPEDGPVIRDRRRFDPATGEVRAGVADQVAPDAPPGPAGGEDITGLEAQVAERTADLQRLQAEYANYRRRVERDRQAVGENALASVFANLLPVLDDIDRARSHGEVEGGFARVADGLEATLTKLGLQRFGEAGEPFDPTMHEALTHGFSDDVAEAVSAEVFQTGYRVGDRVLRPARVAVLEPAVAAPAETNGGEAPASETPDFSSEPPSPEGDDVTE
jgi:molecular chaperone GrpE